MYKDIIVSELEEMASILNGVSEICEDVKPLYDAAQDCKQNATGTEYSYSISRLFFKLIYNPGHLIPNDAAKGIRVEFRIDIQGIYPDENKVEDPIQTSTINILLYGTKGQNDLFSSWHFDYHNHAEKTDNTHPKYHLTFGGSEMYQERATYDWGQTLILPTPRITHPPMDAILGVDFILKNYFDHELLSDVFANTRYTDMIRRAQGRLWRPYALALSSHWKKHDEFSYDANLIPAMIFPELL